jgi:hypothetical protein
MQQHSCACCAAAVPLPLLQRPGYVLSSSKSTCFFCVVLFVWLVWSGVFCCILWRVPVLCMLSTFIYLALHVLSDQSWGGGLVLALARCVVSHVFRRLVCSLSSFACRHMQCQHAHTLLYHIVAVSSSVLYLCCHLQLWCWPFVGCCVGVSVTHGCCAQVM